MSWSKPLPHRRGIPCTVHICHFDGNIEPWRSKQLDGQFANNHRLYLEIGSIAGLHVDGRPLLKRWICLSITRYGILHRSAFGTDIFWIVGQSRSVWSTNAMHIMCGLYSSTLVAFYVAISLTFGDAGMTDKNHNGTIGNSANIDTGNYTR
ncbi:hypothetical protein QTP88_022855 [Uroleucon formosanum]